MGIKFNQGAVDAAKKEAAQRLQRAAVFFVTNHQSRLGISNPRPHKTPSLPGQYPRKRTGFGIAGIITAPTSAAGIAAEGYRVRIGQIENSSYMLILELYKNRLGFKRTADDLRDRIKIILGSKV